MTWRDAAVVALTIAAFGPIAYLLALGAWWAFLNADAEGLEPTNHIKDLDREDGGPGPISQELKEVSPMTLNTKAVRTPRPIKKPLKLVPPAEPPPETVWEYLSDMIGDHPKAATLATYAVLALFLALMAWAVWPKGAP